ncbi:uncharacterized protein LOC117190672 [Drosophila miranda]|uniref:uncharacterized protein LOC117190672 n=1 Tax=Drosophila miranda TaxID=7229 RepID=UPI00143F2BAB|nr:uncharacterized protein LOC117190672 [Drosophila miranda]
MPQLRLRREKHHIGIRSIGDSLTSLKARTTTSIKSRTSGYQLTLQLGITSHIAYQPDSEIDISNWNLPANTPLADESFYRTKRIDLLLGTEAFYGALAVGQIRIGPNLPTLQKTLFGWVVAGRYQRQYSRQPPLCLATVEESIDKNLQQLWKVDSFVDPSARMLPNHRRCEDHFRDTTHQDVSGRIVVRLLFQEDPSCLGSSFDTARTRFFAIERRPARLPEIRSHYISFMQEYESLGHMSLVLNPNLEEPHYYIPHHFVLKPSSTSTKLRVVFDASCRTTSQRSLNDLLLVGPTIQDELYLQLLRFRMHRFGITADVTKMYRQVLVSEKDRKFQYILWRASPNTDLQTYQLNTVTYGTASAPFLATRSLHYLAEDCKDAWPLGAAAVKTAFYVDDLLCGADDIDTLFKLKTEITSTLARGQFPLCKWHSNHPGVMEDESTKELNISENSVSSTLGLTWHQRRDAFSFTFNPKEVYPTTTKRTILSTASSLFDPIGLLSPLVIVSKIILQELWLLKLDWDESVPQNLSHAWSKCLESLNSLSSLAVPRFCLQPDTRSIQIHGFCDASIRAYGCCVYVRTENSLGQVTVKLFTSKSRVAPVKKQSLPKL